MGKPTDLEAAIPPSSWSGENDLADLSIDEKLAQGYGTSTKDDAVALAAARGPVISRLRHGLILSA